MFGMQIESIEENKAWVKVTTTGDPRAKKIKRI